jgi:hypothetical protein
LARKQGTDEREEKKRDGSKDEKREERGGNGREEGDEGMTGGTWEGRRRRSLRKKTTYRVTVKILQKKIVFFQE